MRESFTEENCIFFLNEDENSHHQHDLFEEYKAIMEHRLEKFLHEYSIRPQQLAEALDYGREHPKFVKMVKAIEREDDFQYFKR